jgi:integrase
LIQSAVTAWAETLERKTIQNILGTLQSMMREARNWDYTVGDWRMDQLILPRKPLKPDTRCFTADEIVSIINAAEGQWKAMFCMVAMTGIRRGEVIALRWYDVDLHADVIRPHQAQWQREVKVLKTESSKGTLPIPEPLAVMLRWYRSVWRENEQNLVFTSKVGGMLHPSAIYRDVLHPLLGKLKIQRGGFHAFRHAHSSLLVSEGANPKVWQKQMRHSDSKTVLDVYSHLVGDDHREAVERVAQRLRPLVPSEGGKLLIQ